MSGLTPERRPNKYGVMVTRWVRKDTGSAGKGRSIPKVGKSPEEKLEARRSRTINKMVKLLVLHGYNYDSKDARMFLNETLGKYTNSSSFDVIDALLKKDPTRAVDIELTTSDYPEDKARVLILFSEYMRNDVTGDDCDAVLSGLKDYDEFSGIDDLSAIKGEQHDKAVALLKTGLSILAYDPDYRAGIKNSEAVRRSKVGEFQVGKISEFKWHIEDRVLVDTVLSNVDRLDDILDFMKARKVFDGEAVQQYLGEHSALNKGFL